MTEHTEACAVRRVRINRRPPCCASSATRFKAASSPWLPRAPQALPMSSRVRKSMRSIAPPATDRAA